MFYYLCADFSKKMDYTSQYNITFNGLDNGKDYLYEFKIADKFFSFFEKSEINGGNIDVNVTINKHINSFDLKIKLKGNVKVVCDKCLDEYLTNIEIEDVIMVKYGEETNFDTDEEFVTIDRNASNINISQFIYELAHFALPFVRNHPIDENGISQCNPKMLQKLEEYRIKEEEKEIDPRWENLIEIRNKIK